MLSAESERCRPPIPMSSEKWSTSRWNEWSVWLGTSGRHPSESMVGMGRNMHLSDLPETPDCAILAVGNSRLLPVLEEAPEIAASNDVPVVALKVGRSKRGAQLAQVSVLAQRGFDLDPSIAVWLRERRMTCNCSA
jgi:hypothetical protein